MRITGQLHQLAVRTMRAAASRGVLEAGPVKIPCSIGRSGRKALKREGDGATPRGSWRLVSVYYRADRLGRPRCGLPVRALRTNDGWCDAPGDRNYNRFVRHPYPASAERLWREDGLYDLIVVLNNNQVPRVRGLGSAVFLHCTGEGFKPTAGCVAISRRALHRLLCRVGPRTRLVIP